MNLPRNVFLFEALLYTSLTLDCLAAAVHNRTPTVDVTEKMIMASTWFDAAFILAQIFFVYHAARDRKSWARLALAAVLVLSVIALIQTIVEKGIELDSMIEIVSCALTTQGLYFSFTGNARSWFNA
jgi:hypothetical protein